MSACRYEEGYDLDETLGWMKERWSEEKGSAREEGRARWLLGIKSATRQALQVRLGLYTFTLSTWCHAGVHVCCNPCAVTYLLLFHCPCHMVDSTIIIAGTLQHVCHEDIPSEFT